MKNVKELKNKMIDELIGKEGLDIAIIQSFERCKTKEQQDMFVRNWMNKQMIKKIGEPIYLDFDTIFTKQEAEELIKQNDDYYIEDECLYKVEPNLETKLIGKVVENENKNN